MGHQKDTNLIKYLKAIRDGKIVRVYGNDYASTERELLSKIHKHFPRVIDKGNHSCLLLEIEERTIKVTRSKVMKVLSSKFNACKYGEIMDSVLDELGFNKENNGQ